MRINVNSVSQNPAPEKRGKTWKESDANLAAQTSTSQPLSALPSKIIPGQQQNIDQFRDKFP